MSNMPPQILLTTVFKPFGIDDLFSRKENIPELMMSQITRVQGIFSYRAWHANSGLHMIASNCGAFTTVMEWPSLKDFEDEIRTNKYDYVGISFIPSTLLKMREMVNIVRKISPISKIIIGGHGVMIPDIENFVDTDYICMGDGIRYLRNILGFSSKFNFNHPTVTSTIVEFLGIPIPFLPVGQIVAGLGCAYGCEFCVTSAFFKCKYQPFLSTGIELFELIKKQCIEENLKSFWIIDENFLQNKKRAVEFRDLLAQNYKDFPEFTIDMIWSSSNNVIKFEPEQLAEMGITKLWIGYESIYSNYNKNKDVDIKKLISGLKEYGISTLLSCTMLCDFHDEPTWNHELDVFTKLGQSFSQFLPLTAFPGTPLYKRFSKENRLLNIIPWEEQHALTTSTHKHPFIPIWKQKDLVINAYHKEYSDNGPSQIRDLLVQTRGYKRFNKSKSDILKKRAGFLKNHLKNQTPWLIATRDFVNDAHKSLVDETSEALRESIGNENYQKTFEISKYLIKTINKVLQQRNNNEVKYREPGLRKTKYDGKNPVPIEISNPPVW